MSDRTLRWAGVAMGVIALSLFVYAGTLDVEVANPIIDIMGLVAFISPALVGAYLVWRLPQNAVGWTLAGFGLTFTLGVIGETVALTGGPLAAWGAWFSSWAWVASTVLLLVLLPLRFPDGRLPSPRFRWVGPIALVGLGLAVLGLAFRASVSVSDGESDVVVELPLNANLPTTLADLAALAGIGLILAAVGGALTACVLRYRRSAGSERQQMKVFVSSVVFCVSGMALNFLFFGVGNVLVANALFATLVLVLVASIAMAVLRYRLYEFERVISRTVTYSLVVLILGSVYVLGAAWLPTRWAGGESPLFVAGSTLAVAALFTPVRRHVMRWVDRRFNRSSYDAELVTDSLAARLRDQVDADRLAADWADVVSGTLEPSMVGVWVRAGAPPAS
jgi:hypothetical protein